MSCSNSRKEERQGKTEVVEVRVAVEKKRETEKNRGVDSKEEGTTARVRDK